MKRVHAKLKLRLSFNLYRMFCPKKLKQKKQINYFMSHIILPQYFDISKQDVTW